MSLVWGLVGVSVVALFVLWWWRRDTTTNESPERPVLPAHYSSLLEWDRSRYPGLCSSCGAENTPGYRFCKECGEPLPTGTQSRSDTDVSQIFKE